jgi:ubiquinone/menaquinone biosynthesis C-methylase UbiE
MNATPDLNAAAAATRAVWRAGNYGEFAKYLEPAAREILSSWHIPPGRRMLDVACGAGQISIPAARAGVRVTGVDIAAHLIEQARRRAVAEGLSAQFDEGDAAQLPYPDASFDAVVSMLGVMFAPEPDEVAAELIRVCRPGGRIILVNWPPAGLVAEGFKLFARYAPPPPGIPSPLL